MPPYIDDETDWDDDWDENDFGEDDEPTIPCPYCGEEIYEDSVRCPHCGQYISEEDSPPGKKPWWIIVGALLCLAATVLWLVF